MTICPNCEVAKDDSGFYVYPRLFSDGEGWCKECTCKSGYWSKHYEKYKEGRKEKQRQYYLDNPEKFKKRRKEYYSKNRKEILAQQKLQTQQNPEIRFKRGLHKIRKATGLSSDQLYDYYNEQFAKQDGCCALCGRHETEFYFRLNFDHDHKTGKLRALLCTNCNAALGHLQDDAELCLKAYQYLRKQ